MSNAADLTAAAHDYHKRGWRIIPLHSVDDQGNCSCHRGDKCDPRNRGKHPKDSKWQDADRLSGADVQALWDSPNPPNIGIATGPTSGFWVLDIDPDAGGFETMKALVAEHGALPETFVAQTGSGGFHYYFKLPVGTDLRNSSNRVGQGIDTRAKGGQVVAAPSRSAKGGYRVVADLPVAAAPQWLIEAASKAEVDPATVVTAEDLPKPDDLTQDQWTRLSSYARKAIASEVRRLDALGAARTANPSDYRGEPWNHTTFEVACSLIEFANSPWNDYSMGHAYQDVFAHAPRDGEFDDWTVNKTFESARERIGPKARPMPQDRRQEPPEQDPLFAGPDVRNPSVGDGPDKATPVALTGRVLFGGDRGKEPMYDQMALAVLDVGPVGYGVDRDFWSYDNGVWSPCEFLIEDRLSDILGDSWREAHATNVRTPIRKRSQPITGEPLEALMNFRNGMLDWRSGVLSEHSPSYGSTVQFACDWDPEATCPRFEAWLNDTLHPDYVRLAWEMIGYLMLSGNPKHRAFLLFGIGGSGKSTLLRLITHLLNERNIAAETLDDLNGNRFRTASLFGKIANIAGDIDAGYQENTATFKRITGQDMITAENKGKKPFRFVNWAVPVFSANKIPGSADVTEGYLRRWEILRFTKTVPAAERIDGLEEQFYGELPGVAVKAVAALHALMERGDFYGEGEVVKGKDEFAQTLDQVRQWLSSGDALQAPQAWTPLADLYASYEIWAKRSGQRPVREQEFGHRLESIGYPAERQNGSVCHEGLTAPPAYARQTTPANMWD